MFNDYVLSPVLENFKSKLNRNAFCIDDTFYTYSDFQDCISRIRQVLNDSPPSGSIVGIVANDDLETYASIFALWLEGLAYVPLHPMQPVERNAEIIEMTGINTLLYSKAKPDYSVNLIETSNLPPASTHTAPKTVADDEMAYILFTSGSTGKPKGVPITRKSAGAFMESFWKIGFQISEDDRCLQCYDLTFDLSIQSFLVPLTKGACTFTIPHDQIKFSYVFGLLDDHQLTFASMPPSMIRYLKPYFEEIDVPSMRYSILAAEASPLDLIKEWSTCIPNAEIYDLYGPTEATIYCTYYKVPTDGTCKSLNGLLSIGQPMDGITAVICDENKNIISPGEKGELCVAGVQVTQGYWNNPEKNAESFFEMEHEGTRKRFYRTGDSCFIDSDGDIMYAGRIDNQVKIQGYRVELGEIEFHAREFMKNNNAIAAINDNSAGHTEMVLFVEGEFEDIEGLRQHLSAKVPSYMVPARYIIQDVFPLNTNAKVDRKVLKSLLVN